MCGCHCATPAILVSKVSTRRCSSCKSTVAVGVGVAVTVADDVAAAVDSGVAVRVAVAVGVIVAVAVLVTVAVGVDRGLVAVGVGPGRRMNTRPSFGSRSTVDTGPPWLTAVSPPGRACALTAL